MDLSTNQTTRLKVEFYEKAVHLKFQSEQEQRPMYKTVNYIRIYTPGALTIIDRPMYMGEDDLKYPQQWQAFKAGKAAELIGTPLDKWAGSHLDVAEIKQLEALGYFTVENVANMPDFDLKKVRGGHDLKQRAKDFLDLASGHSQIGKLLSQIQNDAEKLTMKDEQIKSMQEKLDEILAERSKEKSQKTHKTAA